MGGTEEIHVEIQPHPMSRLELGTSRHSTAESAVAKGNHQREARGLQMQKNMTKGTTTATLLL